jgi:superfamily II DNA or RNA helicase
MIQPLRPYQESAVVGVYNAWQSGHRSVCLVAPTGAGKTRLGEEFVYRARAAAEPVLWIAHRRELLRQAAERLRLRFGALAVGIIAASEDPSPYAAIQVATVQTLLARDERPPASLIVFDEAHHYVADDWKALAAHYSSARALGLTATPERQDGRPLGDIFDAIVVAAKYSELLREGFLVPCRVYQPPKILGSDLAQDPLEAYKRFGEGSRAFVFCGAVDVAYQLAERCRTEGIPAATIEAKTPKAERDQILADFAAGAVRVLTNVFALTEGVDVPAARTVILASACSHVGGYLQRVGRVLRPHPEKPDAIVIDLTGATLLHGMPTEDREYSLEGKGIIRTSLAPLKTCPKCAATILAAYEVCPECGWKFGGDGSSGRAMPKVWDLELRAVFAGADTPSTAKEREYRRLRELARSRGWNLYFVVKEYRKLFGEAPRITDATPEEKLAEYERLRALGAERKFKPGFAKVRFKELFGHWPERDAVSWQ